MKSICYAILALIFFSIAVYCFYLPIPIESNDNATVVMDDEFESLPNADFAQQIKESININDFETAIDMAEAAMELFPEDAPAMADLRNVAINENKFKESPLGITYSFIDGFVTGDVSNLSSGIGSTVGDMFVYGDIRDFVKEIVSNDPDELIIVLSAVGIGSSLIPWGDGVVSITKTMRKISALSEPMTKFLLTHLNRIKTLSPTKMADELKIILLPLYDLSKQVKSFSQYKLLLKACKNNDAVKFLATLGTKSQKSLNELGQILAIVGAKNTKTAQAVLDYVIKTSGTGIETLKKGIKKGRRGVELILKNPSVVSTTSRIGKLVRKFVPEFWNSFVKALPSLAKLARAFSSAISAAFSALFSFLCLRAFFPARNYLRNKLTTMNQKSILEPNFSDKEISVNIDTDLQDQLELTSSKINDHNLKIMNILYGGLLSGKKVPILFALIVFLFTAIVILYPTIYNFSLPIFNYGGERQPSGDASIANIFIIILLVIFTIFLFFICAIIKNNLISIWNNNHLSAKQKLLLLDNMDIWFDLPLYGGLAMTILAFIIICFSGATNARYIAYIATLAGIICTAWMRIMYMHRIRRELLSEQDC